jgi:hypothetical protein
MGPEIATSRRFAKQVLERETFRQQRLYLIIDEVHVVDQWLTFRKDYGKLAHLRSRLPPSTRALGASATLDPATRAAVIEKGGFRYPVLINITTDRPEIYIEFRKSKSNIEDLHFLFPDELTVEETKQLPKTLVYFDSKQELRAALAACRDWLAAAGLSYRDAEQTVGAYYASLREKTKKNIRDSFRKPDSPCRIMLATEAMGMGVEMEKIQIVVQYGSAKILRDVRMLKSLVQRMGRAARVPGEKGHFIWLVKPWFFCGISQPHTPAQASRLQISMSYDEDTDEIKYSVSDQKKWTNLDTIYKDLSRNCPRKVLQAFFTPQGSKLLTMPFASLDRCCYRCHPDGTMKSKTRYTPEELDRAVKLLTVTENEKMKDNRLLMLGLPPNQILKATPKRFGPVLEALREWREIKTQELYGGIGMLYSPVLLLPDVAAEKLAHMNILCTEEFGQQFIEHFLPMWPRRKEFSAEIKVLISQVCKRPLKEGRDMKTQKKRDEALLHERMVAELKIRDERSQRRYGIGNVPMSGIAGDDVGKYGRRIKKRDQQLAKKGNSTTRAKAKVKEPQGSQDRQLDYRPPPVATALPVLETSPLTSPPDSSDEDDSGPFTNIADSSMVTGVESQSPCTPTSQIRRTSPYSIPSTPGSLQRRRGSGNNKLPQQAPRTRAAKTLLPAPSTPQKALENAGISRSGRQRHRPAKYTESQQQAAEVDKLISADVPGKGRKRTRL